MMVDCLSNVILSVAKDLALRKDLKILRCDQNNIKQYVKKQCDVSVLSLHTLLVPR